MFLNKILCLAAHLTKRQTHNDISRASTMLADQQIERGIKRLKALPTVVAIAREAGLSTRTIDRIASGQKVASATYRRLSPVLSRLSTELADLQSSLSARY